jgi:DNA-binding NarL/FixJ family response regulator
MSIKVLIADDHKLLRELLAEGKSIREISETLFISCKTTGTHKQNIIEKLEFDNMLQLIKFALKNGIVSL